MTVTESGEAVGHLPMENSRVTKYILDRGAVLASTNYDVSPLVQGGLEIPCRVEIYMPSTVRNRQLIGIYETFVDTLYYLREEENIAGSFVENTADKEMEETTGKKESMKRKSNEKTASSSKDIRPFFQKHRTVSSTKRTGVPNNIVEMNDDGDEE